MERGTEVRRKSAPAGRQRQTLAEMQELPLWPPASVLYAVTNAVIRILKNAIELNESSDKKCWGES